MCAAGGCALLAVADWCYGFGVYCLLLVACCLSLSVAVCVVRCLLSGVRCALLFWCLFVVLLILCCLLSFVVC